MSRRKPITYKLVAILVGFLLLSPLFAQLSDAERAAKAKELERLRSRIETIIAERDQVQSRYAEVQKALRDTERHIGRHVIELKQLDEQLRSQNRHLRQLSQQQQQLQRDVQNQRQLLGDQIRAAYMIGRQEYVKLILNQEDPAVIGRTMAYYNYFNRARVERIDNSRQSLVALIETEKQIKAETEALKDIQQQQLAKKQSLEEASRSRAVVVAKLQKELQNKESDLTRLVQDEKRLSDLIAKLDEAMPDILTEPGKRTPFAKLKGELRWPTKGQVRAIFGQRRASSSAKWNGVMILAQEGHEVKAVSHGRVAYADWLRGYGLLLIIDHGNGYMSLYGQNQAIYKETGEWVEAGETIASVGKSGGQEQAGLYFEIRHNGKPTNPVNWCRRG